MPLYSVVENQNIHDVYLKRELNFGPIRNLRSEDGTFACGKFLNEFSLLFHYFVDEIEEELAPLTEALEPPQSDTYEDKLNRAREATEGLSWIHLLGKNITSSILVSLLQLFYFNYFIFYTL